MQRARRVLSCLKFADHTSVNPEASWSSRHWAKSRWARENLIRRLCELTANKKQKRKRSVSKIYQQKFTITGRSRCSRVDILRNYHIVQVMLRLHIYIWDFFSFCHLTRRAHTANVIQWLIKWNIRAKTTQYLLNCWSNKNEFDVSISHTYRLFVGCLRGEEKINVEHWFSNLDFALWAESHMADIKLQMWWRGGQRWCTHSKIVLLFCLII